MSRNVSGNGHLKILVSGSECEDEGSHLSGKQPSFILCLRVQARVGVTTQCILSAWNAGTIVGHTGMHLSACTCLFGSMLHAHVLHAVGLVGLEHHWQCKRLAHMI